MHDERAYARYRARLADELREKGIRHERVLAAMGAVPRHRFVELGFRSRAYRDEALPIGLKQMISQPYTVAYQTALLDPQPGDRVLEVGTGSGYQAAVLCELGAQVYSIERHRPLLERTRKVLRELGYRVITHTGDGTLGWPAFAPYDGIIVTAGSTEIPTALVEQLRVPDETHRGGRLVIPVGDQQKGQMMNRITRTGPNAYNREADRVFRFVPLIGDGLS